MANQTITCPKCKCKFPLTDALTEQFEQPFRKKYEAATAANDNQVQAKLDEIRQQEKELEEKRQSIDKQVADQLEAKVKPITEQLKAKMKAFTEREREKIEAEYKEQSEDLQKELELERKKRLEMQKQEIDLRKKQREMEQKQQELELDNQRKLDEERKKIFQDAARKASEEQGLKMRTKDELIESLRKQIDELNRKCYPAPPVTTGGSLEDVLREKLESIGAYDKIEKVKKGAKGADLVQTVHNASGKDCGKILWEAKNTKDFQRAWIDKLKRDQQQANADIAVIMSVALPNDMDDCFGIYEDVWVTDLKSSASLARALRAGLIEAKRREIITDGRESIKEVLYNYITSREFSLHVRAVVNSYKQMQEDLEAEKRSMARIWNKREKQISTILDNVTGMYGSIEGLLGNQKALPEIDGLSLAAIG